MKVKQLIDILNGIENKEKPVGYVVGYGQEFLPLDELIGIGEYADCVVLQHEVKVSKKEEDHE